MSLSDVVAAILPFELKGFRAPILAGFIALAVTWLVTPYVIKLAFKHGAVDDPKRDDRRVHKVPLARWGGIGIYLGILVALLVVLPFAYPSTVAFPRYLIAMLAIAGGLAVFGMFDDLKSYSARWQLLALLGAGVVVQFFYGSIGRVQINTLSIPLSNPPAYFVLGLMAIPATAFYIFIVTKTMDTIDGIDGLSSGIAAITATTLVIIGVYGGQPRVAIVAAAIAGASLGFLRHNYNPAKIIMGTSGPYVLGFMLAGLSIVGAFKTAAALALLVPMFAFGVPLFDAFFVITRRALSGVPITQADKRHVHHTLLKQGLSQRQTVWILYTCAAALGAVLVYLVVGPRLQ
ncbi:undecaprenyl/decaprenyl-phosphate alpha-N-acetylglucosaminyl 1-phosphate transferase [bacterium]|nr:MAG: undecaprenyl/decaprenyl-phosphate alpha-N-acetylglucosaminyl 1-phosphate transferase [bacterium]